MKNSQKIKLLMDVHALPKFKRVEFISENFEFLEMKEVNKQMYIDEILAELDNGIGLLNRKQLDNLINDVKNNFNFETLSRKLNIYNIESENIDSIVAFLKNLNFELNKKDIDSTLTVDIKTSMANFSKIIKQGWVGDWESNPHDEGIKSIKISCEKDSNSSGKKSTLVAKIKSIEPIKHIDRIRYRVYISDPKILFS